MAAQHDPGPERAAERGEEHAPAPRHPFRLADGTVRIGTASWTDVDGPVGRIITHPDYPPGVPHTAVG